MQRPRAQGKVGHNQQGGEVEEEKCESESKGQGAKGHKDIDKEKIVHRDSFASFCQNTKELHIILEEKKDRAPKVIKTVISQIAKSVCKICTKIK